MTYFIWSCFWAKQTSGALHNGALQTSSAFKCGNTLNVHHHTWSHLQQPSESPLGEFLNWISVLQKSALIPLVCFIFEVWRTTFRYIFVSIRSNWAICARPEVWTCSRTFNSLPWKFPSSVTAEFHQAWTWLLHPKVSAGTLHRRKTNPNTLNDWLMSRVTGKIPRFLPVNGAIAFACLTKAMSQLKLLTTPRFKPKHTQGSADMVQGRDLPPTQPGRRQQRQAETQRCDKGPVTLLWLQTWSSGGRSRQEDTQSSFYCSFISRLYNSRC